MAGGQRGKDFGPKSYPTIGRLPGGQRFDSEGRLRKPAENELLDLILNAVTAAVGGPRAGGAELTKAMKPLRSTKLPAPSGTEPTKVLGIAEQPTLIRPKSRPSTPIADKTTNIRRGSMSEGQLAEPRGDSSGLPGVPMGAEESRFAGMDWDQIRAAYAPAPGEQPAYQSMWPRPTMQSIKEELLSMGKLPGATVDPPPPSPKPVVRPARPRPDTIYEPANHQATQAGQGSGPQGGMADPQIMSAIANIMGSAAVAGGVGAPSAPPVGAVPAPGAVAAKEPMRLDPISIPRPKMKPKMQPGMSISQAQMDEILDGGPRGGATPPSLPMDFAQLMPPKRPPLGQPAGPRFLQPM